MARGRLTRAARRAAPYIVALVIGVCFVTVVVGPSQVVDERQYYAQKTDKPDAFITVKWTDGEALALAVLVVLAPVAGGWLLASRRRRVSRLVAGILTVATVPAVFGARTLGLASEMPRVPAWGLSRYYRGGSEILVSSTAVPEPDWPHPLHSLTRFGIDRSGYFVVDGDKMRPGDIASELAREDPKRLRLHLCVTTPYVYLRWLGSTLESAGVDRIAVAARRYGPSMYFRWRPEQDRIELDEELGELLPPHRLPVPVVFRGEDRVEPHEILEVEVVVRSYATVRMWLSAPMHRTRIPNAVDYVFEGRRTASLSELGAWLGQASASRSRPLAGLLRAPDILPVMFLTGPLDRMIQAGIEAWIIPVVAPPEVALDTYRYPYPSEEDPAPGR